MLLDVGPYQIALFIVQRDEQVERVGLQIRVAILNLDEFRSKLEVCLGWNDWRKAAIS